MSPMQLRLGLGWLIASFLAGCSGPATTEPAGDAGASASGALVREPGAALEALGRFPAFADHLGRGGALARQGGGFRVERPAPAPEVGFRPAGARALDVTLPASAHGFAHLASGGVEVDVRAEVEDAPFAAIEGALVARPSPSVSLTLVAERGRVEEVRVLQEVSGEYVARWTLSSASPVRLSDGSVEILDADGHAKLATEAMFAVDARGQRRAPTLELVRESAGVGSWTLTARLDTTGMTAPIAFDPAWTTIEGLKVARRMHTATLLSDGKVLVVGGMVGATVGLKGALPSVELFDPAGGGAWSTVAPMSEGRAFHTATRLLDGRVLVAGGVTLNTGAGLSTTEIYDPKTNTWSAGPALPGPRTHHGAARLSDGSVLIAGGLTKDADTLVEPTPAPVIVASDAKSLRTLPATSGAAPFPAGGAVVTGDKRVFFVGGLLPDCTGTTCTGLRQFQATTVFEESTTTWRALAKFRRPRQASRTRSLFTASLFGDGKQMMIVGGADDSGELVDLTTGETYLGGELADLWSAPQMVRLPTGDIISIGGFVPLGPTDSGAETALKLFPAPLIRHAKTLKWVNASPPVRRRWDHTATTLEDGTVLIVGGQNKDGVMPNAEIFKPLGLGDKCVDSGDCASAFCVDGVCCDTTCNGQCEACSSTGKCQPVTGSPRGLRPLCDNPGTDVCAAKVCDGKTVSQCVLPNGSRCAEAVCNVASFVGAATCDGKGTCVKPAAKDCGLFGCTDTGCRTSCAAASDCANGAICISGTCTAASGGACNADLSASIGTDGKETSCHPFKCVQATGKCSDSCVRSDDCAGGFVCGGTSKCEQPVVNADDGGGCTAGRGPASGLGALALGLAALGLTRRRRAR